MPIPSSHLQERLHFAYVHAVVAKAGATCQPYNPDYGTDARISAIKIKPSGGYAKSTVGFECQLKSSTSCEINDQHVVYDLDANTYNHLVAFEDMFGILILFRLPKREVDWLEISEDVMCLRNCCYWLHLTGKKTKNISSKRIFIPRHQLFNPEAVKQLLNQVKQKQAAFRRWSSSK